MAGLESGKQWGQPYLLDHHYHQALPCSCRHHPYTLPLLPLLHHWHRQQEAQRH